DLQLGLPFSVGEAQTFPPLRDLYSAYATSPIDRPEDRRNSLKANYHLLDKSGKVLARIKDFASRPLQHGALKASLRADRDQPTPARVGEDIAPAVNSFVPVWNPAHGDGSKRVVCPASASIVLMGGDQRQLE